jgi:hypothetical protein
VSERADAAGTAGPASLILIEQSGVRHEIPQLSCVTGMARAEQAMRRHGLPLREVKVVSQYRAIARWKTAGLGWRRVVRPPAVACWAVTGMPGVVRVAARPRAAAHARGSFPGFKS